MLKETELPSPRLLSDCLNPYFNGTCSKRRCTKFVYCPRYVLILILMEHAQRDKRDLTRNVYHTHEVLILILMEHAQRALIELLFRAASRSLNPYFNGTCSKRAFFIRPSVLICYIEISTLINAFASEKCTCFLLKTLQR